MSANPQRNKQKTKSPVGHLPDEGTYTIEGIQKQLGIGFAAIKEAIQDGLPIRKVGRRYLIVASEFNQWVKNNPKFTSASGEKSTNPRGA